MHCWVTVLQIDAVVNWSVEQSVPLTSGCDFISYQFITQHILRYLLSLLLEQSIRQELTIIMDTFRDSASPNSIAAENSKAPIQSTTCMLNKHAIGRAISFMQTADLCSGLLRYWGYLSLFNSDRLRQLPLNVKRVSWYHCDRDLEKETWLFWSP